MGSFLDAAEVITAEPASTKSEGSETEADVEAEAEADASAGAGAGASTVMPPMSGAVSARARSRAVSSVTAVPFPWIQAAFAVLNSICDRLASVGATFDPRKREKVRDMYCVPRQWLDTFLRHFADIGHNFLTLKDWAYCERGQGRTKHEHPFYSLNYLCASVYQVDDKKRLHTSHTRGGALLVAPTEGGEVSIISPPAVESTKSRAVEVADPVARACAPSCPFALTVYIPCSDVNMAFIWLRSVEHNHVPAAVKSEVFPQMHDRAGGSAHLHAAGLHEDRVPFVGGSELTNALADGYAELTRGSRSINVLEDVPASLWSPGGAFLSCHPALSTTPALITLRTAVADMRLAAAGAGASNSIVLTARPSMHVPLTGGREDSDNPKHAGVDTPIVPSFRYSGYVPPECANVAAKSYKRYSPHADDVSLFAVRRRAAAAARLWSTIHHSLIRHVALLRDHECAVVHDVDPNYFAFIQTPAMRELAQRDGATYAVAVDNTFSLSTPEYTLFALVGYDPATAVEVPLAFALLKCAAHTDEAMAEALAWVLEQWVLRGNPEIRVRRACTP
ncbi:MAG: hypothetical protein EOO65_00125 [Methanosarcinales archaeon]|nr:MAG: hypothetical protein EOO65_00125 [Methanosarcinales archaeon]